MELVVQKPVVMVQASCLKEEPSVALTNHTALVI